MIGDIIIDEHKQSTAMSFEIFEAYETYSINIHCHYHADETMYTG